jgi:hypothetical protein
MKHVKSWLSRLVMGAIVAGTLASANAAMTAWTDEAGFLSRMPNIDEYFTLTGSAIQVSRYEDPVSHYGFRSYLNANQDRVFRFIGMPTGVGARFALGTTLTFTFDDGTQAVVVAGEDMPGSFFGGFTTDMEPTDRYIVSVMFPNANLPSALTFYAGLDTVIVPEPTTVIAGALLLLPFAASTLTIRKLRRRR